MDDNNNGNSNNKIDNNIILSEGKKVSDKRRLLMFININISCIATFMLGTALTTSLPPIMKDLHITVNTGQWLTSGMALFLAIMTPCTAYLITRFKTKRLYCTSMLFFIIGMVICAFATKFWMMMVGRIIQGCGNGILNAMAQVIILTIFPPEKRGTYMGWYGLSSGVAPVISPIIAGILADTIGWRSIFFLAIGIMGVSFIFALAVFDDVLPTIQKEFDTVSLVLSALSFGGITLGVGNLGSYQILSWQVGFSFVLGLISGCLFSYRQLHISVPFLDIRVFKHRNFTIAVISMTLLQAILMGPTMIFPVYVQEIKGRSATISGLVTLPGSLAMALVSPFAGNIYDRIGMKQLFIVGSTILIFSHFVVYFISVHQSIWILSGINIFRSVALGILLMPLVTWSMKGIPVVKTSDATALFNSIRYIGNAVGTAIFISITTMVADAMKGRKESPQMYGINVSFLIMSIISVVVLMLGIFSGRNSNNSGSGSSTITTTIENSNNKKGDLNEKNELEFEIEKV